MYLKKYLSFCIMVTHELSLANASQAKGFLSIWKASVGWLGYDRHPRNTYGNGMSWISIEFQVFFFLFNIVTNEACAASSPIVQREYL